MKCVTVNKSIGWYNNQQRKLELNPEYQREAGAWSLARKQLFIDSLLNDFDIPKIYLAELGNDGPYEYAVIDGKQRITSLLAFLDNQYPLSEEFAYSGSDIASHHAPQKNQYFKDFDEVAQQTFKDIQLASTLVTAKDDEEIESLFTRLNDGEPLNSAEYRNAFGGQIVKSIRDISEHDFFVNYVAYKNTRYAYRETACRLIFIESEILNNKRVPDIKKPALDKFTKDNKDLAESKTNSLNKKVRENLNFMAKCFDKNSKELSKQSMPQIYYIWLRQLRNDYGHPQLTERVRVFVNEFLASRIENNQRDEELRDPILSEFSYLSGQGTNNADSMEKRVSILNKLFLEKFPDVDVLDPKRLFSEDEKFVLFQRAGGKCQYCGTTLGDYKTFHADHIQKWAHGGATTLENAQALCVDCNLKKG